VILTGRRRGRRSIAIILPAAFIVILAGAGTSAAPTIKGDQQAGREVASAFEKFLAAKTWRTRMSAGGGTIVTEHVAPDRFHVTIAQGNTSTEIYLIGRQTWMRTTSGCTRTPGGVAMRNPREMMEHGADTVITASRLGPATIDGTATQGYALIVEAQGTTTREKLYVANATGYPRRLEIEAAQGATVIDYFDFNAPITINDPPC
jgi:hypothetical protein